MTKPRLTILQRFGYLLSAHWLREILQTVFTISLARYATEIYGQFMLAINMGHLLLFATEFGLNQHLSTMLARKKSYPTRILAQVTLIKSVFLFIGWLTMLGFIFWQDYPAELRIIILLVATPIGLSGIGNSFFVACQVLERQDVEGKTRGFASLIGYGYGMITMFTGIPTVAIAMFKAVETLCNLAVVAKIFFRRLIEALKEDGINKDWQAWREGLVFTAMAICAIFYNKINLFFLQNHAGSEGVAQYSVTWQLVDGISILVSSLLLGKVLFPLLTKLWVNNRNDFLTLARNSAAWLVAAALPVSYLLFVESDRIITLIYGSGYAPAILMQKQLVGCIILAFLHNLASYLMISMNRQRILLVMYIVGLAINLAACSLLIPDSPLSGAAYAILLTKALMALMTVSFCQFSIKLFTLRDTLRLATTIGAAAAIHFGLSDIPYREARELLVIAPLLFHTFRLYRRQQTTLAEQRNNA
ncbi:polysaccharide biosynthesis C-terminal domain-containing protein [uncultured Pseudodesulfovibrio sp.]|uniref:polysaccharide biosynthesis C-terminal domain-containing protein n=1 Tax=uncultured Pseudodesulfovibrio sp. TaxID=2035858 RepID=UPI0029C8443A|nr:polysaccharide biosynthesis C-terminal domain-containing protein [uncultured Pseudodesulfovibrio sp.]